MKILFFTSEPWPTHRADVTVLFGRCLPGLGVESHLVTGSEDGDLSLPKWSGGQSSLFVLRGGQMRKRLSAVVHAVRSAWCLDQGRCGVLQVRDMPFVASLVLVIARVRRQRFFYWMSYPIPEDQILLARARGLSAGWMKFLYPFVAGHVGLWLLRHWVLPRADHVFVQSPRMRQDLMDQGVPGERMTPVLMGVDCAALRELPADTPRDPRLLGRRVIGYLGTTDRPRQVEGLFPMLARVRQVEPDAVLLVVGDTGDEPHRRWLREQAARAGVADAVVWAGWLPMRDGWQLIRQADVAVSMIPRGRLLDCSSPTKVPEYLALGLPVVCNDNPDQQALIEATGAGRCVPYTPANFAAAVLELLALPADERARMADAGRRYVQAHRDYPRLAQALAQRYRGLLGQEHG